MLYRVSHLTALLGLLLLAGCGSTKQHTVTEQLLSSDAVDRAVSQIDFRVLAGRKVYVDAEYVQPIKNIGFVNDRYILSSLRQQMAAAGCLLQDSANDAEVIVEPRVGALGTELHEVVYGMPANNLLSNVASLAPNAPAIPAIPEISLAKKNQHLGAAKIAVFAYERESRDPIWQSGIAQSESRARDMWLLGAGPFQSGVIYDRTKFAGSDLAVPLAFNEPEKDAAPENDFEHPHVFLQPPLEHAHAEPIMLTSGNQPDKKEDTIQPLAHQEPVEQPSSKPTVEPAAKSAEEKSSRQEQAKMKPQPSGESAADTPELQNDDNASHLPAELRWETDLYWKYLHQPQSPWYNPAPQVTSATE